MSATQAEVFEEFRAIDVPEDKALRAAAALASAFAKSEDETGKSFTKRDGAIDKLTGEVGSLNAKLTSEVAVLNARIVNHGWGCRAPEMDARFHAGDARGASVPFLHALDGCRLGLPRASGPRP